MAWPEHRVVVEIEGVSPDGGRHQRIEGFDVAQSHSSIHAIEVEVGELFYIAVHRVIGKEDQVQLVGSTCEQLAMPASVAKGRSEAGNRWVRVDLPQHQSAYFGVMFFALVHWLFRWLTGFKVRYVDFRPVQPPKK